MSNDFKDMKKELFVITTITNWNEPPRMRHEIARQLSKKYNVLFIQIYSQRGKVRKRINVGENLMVDKSGIFIIGGSRIFIAFPIVRKVYNKILAKLIQKLIVKYGYKQAHLINFQYDFPEIYDIPIIKKKIYFCNDDFVNLNLNSSQSEIKKKEKVQSEVIEKSDIIITTSYPLKDKLGIYNKKTEVILSGHRFDLEESKRHSINKSSIISVCYLGFLNQYIAIDWFKYILSDERIKLTVIGPVAYKYLQNKLCGINNLFYIKSLTDASLQAEMLKHDVMVMPYSSPLANRVITVSAKLFQYLAVGKPVVSSDMKNLITLPDGFVYKASSQEEFLMLIKKACHENSGLLKNHRIEYSANHTWDQRGIQLFNIIKEINK